MLKLPALILFAALAFGQAAPAQDDLVKCWVTFTDKSGVDFDPESYFHPLALERREALGIDPNDARCWPINPEYAAQVGALLQTQTAALRWTNSLVGYANSYAIPLIEALPCVKEVRVSSPQPMDVAQADQWIPEQTNAVLHGQTEVMGRSYLESQNLNGAGMRIAVLDAGFKNVDINPAFDHLRAGGHIISTYDFVSNDHDPYHSSTHGSFVLSCIGGLENGTPMGLAQGADFILVRTERDKFEFKGEEENWMEGVEYADKMGAHIINSSLGYSSGRYYQYEMDGNHAGVSHYAKVATRLGILVVNAAGNDGDGFWKVICAPADVDSVLTVGAVDSDTRIKVDFSSIGPTADKRMKPDVCANGWAYASGPKGEKLVPGTSFSSPLVAGFAACIWQAHPDWTNMQVFDAVRESGHLYPYYDYFHGFGIPQAIKALAPDSLEQEPTFEVSQDGHHITVTIKDFGDSGIGKTLLEAMDDWLLSTTPPPNMEEGTPSDSQKDLAVEAEEAEEVEELESNGDVSEGDEEVVLELDLDIEEDASCGSRIYESPYLFVHFEHTNGQLAKYQVIQVSDETIRIYIKPYRGDTIRIYYKGYTYEQLLD